MLLFHISCLSDKLQDNTKRMIGGDLFPPEEQPKPKKPNVIKPFSHSGSSPFQPWKPFCRKSLDVEQANPHLTNSNTNEVQADKPSCSNGNNQQDMDQKRLNRYVYDICTCEGNICLSNMLEQWITHNTWLYFVPI